MKKVLILSIVACVAAIPQPSSAATIAFWNFESPAIPADATDLATYPNAIAPTTGTGNAGGVHASALSDWSTPTGNGSTDSFSVNNWGVNDYFQFTIDSTGFTQVYVGFSQVSSSTGPRDFRLDYSSNGGTSFTSAGAYTVLVNASPNTWGASTPVPATFYTFDLSAVTALANNSAVVFRLVDTSTTSAGGATVAVAGTSRVDGFTVADAPVPPPVPEPTTLVSLLGGVGMLMGFRRLRGNYGSTRREPASAR